ncbi:hypothetical protein C5Y96_13265 [Blastopirellula marina]|uniref:Uncharacterized protein n=1 Tax=Blastopirellula marina TaxID=124 RepID=A0A2S8FGM1_9BACT|nr:MULTISPECIES: hypothetical protein [Pirellulaceae]PQO31305.1 hypothetical protein C5Y96_13265 [Blastopirellula marina]RCS51699.1 hypothetical protein DTL36_13275 [Bremerella cremea]
MIQSHHLPTCDDVFEVLTRAPFPTGQHETDMPIQRHLTVCHSCRELAEALRPATDMLAHGQAHTTDDDSLLPVFLADDSMPSHRCITDQPERQTTDIVAAIRGPLIGLALCLMIVLAVQGNWSHSSSGSDNARPTSGNVVTAGASGGANLADLVAGSNICSLVSVDAAVQNNGTDGELLSNLADHNFTAAHCCSQCHHAESDKAKAHNAVSLKGPQMLALVNRCQHCHAK